MKRKNRHVKVFLSSVLGVVIFAALVGTGAYFFLFPRLIIDKPAEIVDNSFGWKFPVAKFPAAGTDGELIAYSTIRDPGGISQGLPVRLKIPKIGVNSAIEDALVTPDGRMDVPAGSRNVAWFARGPHPGQEGSAVIAGHFGIDKGVPKVFYNLNKLRAGDKIYVEDDSGKTLAFIVRRTQSFDRNADATTVFTSSDGIAHLNIITCEGIWNQVNDSYPQRLVIFTDSIPGEGAIGMATPAPIPPKLPTAAKTTMTPTPTPTPTVEPTPEPEESMAPVEVSDSPTSTPVIIEAAKSLFATPMDSLITTLLLISLLVIGIKIVRP